MAEKKTLAERVGEAHLERLIELFLQNELFGKPTITEIIDRMPEANFTLGKLVAIRRDYPAEIQIQMQVYHVTHGKVPPVGETKINRPHPLKIELAKRTARFTEALLPPLKAGDRHAKTRRAVALNLVFGTGEISEVSLRPIIRRLGIVAFLESEGFPNDIAVLVQKIRIEDGFR